MKDIGVRSIMAGGHMSRAYDGILQAVAVIGTATAMLASCESPTNPQPGAQFVPVAIDSTVDVPLASGAGKQWFTFDAPAGSSHILLALALEGAVRFEAWDPADKSAGTVELGPSGAQLFDSPILVLNPSVAGSWKVGVRAADPGTAARGQFRLIRLTDEPEHLSPFFAIGDTVSGEMLWPSFDIDAFVAHAEPGQDVVVVAEAPSATDSALLSVTVTDSAGRDTIAWRLLWPAGVRGSLTSGRIHPPSTGTVRFIVRQDRAGFFAGLPISPVGAYRFWTYAIDPAPEHQPGEMPVGSVVSGERLDRAGDIDVFTLDATAGSEVNIFFQSRPLGHLEVAPDAGPAFLTLPFTGDTSLLSNSRGRMTLPAGGPYRLRVVGDGLTVGDTGQYRLLVYPIDRRPERVPAEITAGDTLDGEAIDLPGDVDEFSITLSPSDSFRAFLQAGPGVGQTLLQLDVLDQRDNVLATIRSAGGDTALLGQATAPFASSASGALRLRVSDVEAYASPSSGPYRLFVARVNPKPESLPDTVAFGDSLIGEALQFPGDIDEFRLHVRDTCMASIVLRDLTVAPEFGFIYVGLVDSATGAVIRSTSMDRPGLYVAFATPTLAPGTYLVRVWSDYLTRGPYRLWLYGFQPGPETARDSIAIGDTVGNEALDVPGDSDTFRFFGQRGQHVDFLLQSFLPAAGDVLEAIVRGPTQLIAGIAAPAPGASLETYRTGRVDLAETGIFTITVADSNPAAPLARAGPYRFAVLPVSSLPEHADTVLAVGDSVTTEVMDFPGDWDQFTLTGAPGQEVNFLLGSDTPCGPCFSIRAVDPATGDTLAGDNGFVIGTHQRILGPVRIPAGGRLTVALFEWGRPYTFTGPYWLAIRSVNRAPETAPAGVAVGDTVRAEAIEPPGDIDEFTITGTPGDTVSAWFRLLADAAPAGTGIQLTLVDAAGDDIATFPLTAASSGFTWLWPEVIPASGRFTVRVRGWDGNGTRYGTAPYEFFFQRGP